MHKPVVLYLPGLDGTGRLIQKQQSLFDEFDVLAISYPQDRVMTYEQLVDEAMQRLTSYRNGERVTVLAESFGGGVALNLALQNPDLLDRLVLVNTFAYFPSRANIKLASLFSGMCPNRPPFNFTKWMREHLLFSPDLPQETRREFWDLVGDVSMSAMARRLQILAHLDLRPRLPEVSVPTLVMVAPNDRLVKPSAGYELKQRIPHANLIELPVGHVALIHPKVDVRDWLNNRQLWLS